MRSFSLMCENLENVYGNNPSKKNALYLFLKRLINHKKINKNASNTTFHKNAFKKKNNNKNS